MLNIPGDYASMLRNQRPDMLPVQSSEIRRAFPMLPERIGEQDMGPMPPPPALPERSVLVRPEMAMNQPAGGNMTPAQRIRSLLANREARVR